MKVWKSPLAHLVYSTHCTCSETNIGNVKFELNKQGRKSYEKAVTWNKPAINTKVYSSDKQLLYMYVLFQNKNVILHTG